MKKTFEEFKAVALIAVYFREDVSIEDRDIIFNDWYVMYKEQKNYDSPLEWLQFQLPADEVNRITHDFWFDDRGVMLLYVYSRVN